METGRVDPDWTEFDKRCAEEGRKATTMGFIK